MAQVVGALTTAILGLVATSWGTFAQVADSGSLGPWASVGGIAMAVSALSYVAKLLADGRLVAQPISELAKAAEAREHRLMELVEDNHEREDAFRALLLDIRRNP